MPDAQFHCVRLSGRDVSGILIFGKAGCMPLVIIRRLVSTGFLAGICGIGGLGCTSETATSSGDAAEVPQPLLAPATPPGRVSIAELRDELGVGEQAQFVRTGDEITNINLSGSDVSDLSPLKGLPLVTLSISECPVDDLSPLTGMPLEGLSAQDTRVADLAPLASTQLREIYLLGSPVADLSPLAKLPITQLNVVGTKITDIEAIKQMPLHTLWIGSTSIDDLSVLRGKSLVSLDIEETPVDDLSPLAEMSSLRRLNIAGTEITDLAPLAGLQLQRLIFDPARIAKGLEMIREMSSLQELGVDFDHRMAPAEFWTKYDAGALGG